MNTLRTLILMRHAKTHPANFDQNDFDRTLMERGCIDAENMAKKLFEAGYTPNLICSSTAKRTQQTTNIIAKIFNNDAVVAWQDSLYLCSDDVIKQNIYNIDDKESEVMIVAHNNGITDFANSLTQKFWIDNMPTSSIVVAQALSDNWQSFFEAEIDIPFYIYPQKH